MQLPSVDEWWWKWFAFAVCVCYLSHIRVASSNLCNKCNFIGKRLHCNIYTRATFWFFVRTTKKFCSVPWHVFNVHIEVEYLLVVLVCIETDVRMNAVRVLVFIHFSLSRSVAWIFGWRHAATVISESLSQCQNDCSTHFRGIVSPSSMRWTVNVAVCVRTIQMVRRLRTSIGHK